MSKLKYGMATVSAIAAFVGVASLSLPQALAGDRDEGVLPLEPKPFEEQLFDQQSWAAQRAKHEYGLLKQECDTLHYSQPQAYEACLEKAKSTRDNLLTQAQGLQQTGQGPQGSAPSQSGQEQARQEQGPIDKVTAVVKEKLTDWGLRSPDQGQPGAGQQGQGSQQPSGQGVNPLQQGFEAGQGAQGQSFGQQTFGAGSAQGSAGQQGAPQGQQFQGQQGQSAQGSFQGGTYGQQPQGQALQQTTPSQQFQTGGTQGQGIAEDRDYPPSTPSGLVSTGPGFASTPSPPVDPLAKEEHMNSVKYYQELARRQFEILKQECEALRRDPTVYDQCQQHAKSVRDKIAGMAEQG